MFPKVTQKTVNERRISAYLVNKLYRILQCRAHAMNVVTVSLSQAYNTQTDSVTEYAIASLGLYPTCWVHNAYSYIQETSL